MQAAGLVEFAGAGGAEELPGTAAAIVADSAVGGREVRVAAGSAFAVGSRVLVKRFGDRAWPG